MRILPGLNPGSPKYCGLEIVGGRHLPDDWQGNLLTNDFRANRVCRFVVSDNGAGFSSREMPELIKTSHRAFRPIDVKMGPDGAIYIADWYNPIIQHGEVDFRDPRRDHTHGRIWRVTAKGRKLVEKPRLVDASIDQLLDSLKSPEPWTRHFAKRVLKERGAKIVAPELDKWVSKLGPEQSIDRLEALWTYQSINVVNAQLLNTLLNDQDGRVRAAAVRVVQHWSDRLENPITLLGARARDENARVRLETVRVLAHLADPKSIEVAMSAFERPVDPFLAYALWLTVRETFPRWLPNLEAGTLAIGGKGDRLLFAAYASGSSSVVGPVLEALRSGKIAPAHEASALFAGCIDGRTRRAFTRARYCDSDFDLGKPSDASARGPRAGVPQ